VLLGSMVGEHERALGGWQAEWQALAELLALSGGAVAAAGRSVATLEVDEEAMAANLSRTGGRLLAERLVFELAPLVGRAEAAEAVARAAAADDFGSALAGDPVTGRLGRDRIGELLEPAGYLGVASAWIDRALQDHRQEAS
jgi:3-carboxy-cis,cis-muconate cycloisomerase